MSSRSAVTDVQHPDNLLSTGGLPAHLEDKLRTEGIRFATKLQASNGHTFLLCGQRCPCEAGAEMLRDALRVRQGSQRIPDSSKGRFARHPGRREASLMLDTQAAEPV